MADKVALSEEKKFMYHDAFNKGHIQTPSMVETCIGLSNHAKTVYSNILNHIYEKGHSAFPSTYRLAVSCSCSINSVIAYIEELVDKGFISKESGGRGRSNHYHVKDCHEIPLLKVSEVFWKSMSSLVNLYGWKKMLPAKEKVLKYMDKQGYRLQDMETDSESEMQLTNLLKVVLKGGQIELGLLPKNMKFQKPQKEIVAAIETKPSKVMDVQISGTKKDVSPIVSRNLSVGVDKNHWRLLDVEKWNIQQFKMYFYDKYIDIMGQPHPSNDKRHTGSLRNVLKNLDGNKELLKKYIDSYFEIGYDNLSLDYFSSATRLGEIQAFITNGAIPFYLKKKSRGRIIKDFEKDNVPKANGKDVMNKLLGGADK